MSLSEAKLREAASIAPSPRQLAWQELEFYGFVHFGMNTFTGREWGDGRASPALFDPARLDPDQWAAAFKSAGMQGLILTCKHHDGFCLWPSAHTDYSVKHAPWKGGRGDVVAETAAACRRAGLKFGVYLSPWDRHDPRYGAGKPYDDYYVAQLTELLTGYGELFCVWLDGACGEGPNGRRQVYDWPRYYRTIRALQPGAVISVCGPDVRWCGNEAGHCRPSEWSVVPAPTVSAEQVAKDSQQTNDRGASIQQLRSEQQDLGSRELLRHFDTYRFSPAECDVSVNLAWFWHDDLYYQGKKQRTGADIARIYMNTVGGNAMLLLNVPPNNRGRIGQREIDILQTFTAIIREKFARPVVDFSCELRSSDGARREAPTLKSEDGAAFGEREHAVVLRLPEKRQISLLSLEEELRFSQRVERFAVYDGAMPDAPKKLYEGTVIGSGKFCEFSAVTDTLVLNILQSRGAPHLKNIQVYE